MARVVFLPGLDAEVGSEVSCVWVVPVSQKIHKFKFQILNFEISRQIGRNHFLPTFNKTIG
jgi:hypothetical protein